MKIVYTPLNNFNEGYYQPNFSENVVSDNTELMNKIHIQYIKKDLLDILLSSNIDELESCSPNTKK